MENRYIVTKVGFRKNTGEPYSIANRIIEGKSKKDGKPYGFLAEKGRYREGHYPIGTILINESTEEWAEA